jgi:hypothetical protein
MLYQECRFYIIELVETLLRTILLFAVFFGDPLLFNLEAAAVLCLILYCSHYQCFQESTVFDTTTLDVVTL